MLRFDRIYGCACQDGAEMMLAGWGDFYVDIFWKAAEEG